MTVILLTGDNLLEIGDAVRAIREPFNPADILTFEGASAPMPSISEACRTAGLFDPDRLVVVHDLHDRFKGNRKDGALEELKTLVTSVAPTTTLLLVSAEMPPDHPLMSAVRAARGEVRMMNAPRKQELPRWVTSRAKNHRASIRPAAAELLAELAGSNPVLLDSELEKLATFAGVDQTITVEMVDALVGAVPQESIFALVDAISVGDQAEAFRLLHAQIGQASSQPTDVALYLIRMLARQTRILLSIRLGQATGRSNSQITSDLKLSRYFADRYFRQARRLPTERLAGTFDRLASLDHALKTGKADPATGLDLLVADLCA